jgi:hypothetical protein
MLHLFWDCNGALVEHYFEQGFTYTEIKAKASNSQAQSIAV